MILLTFFDLLSYPCSICEVGEAKCWNEKTNIRISEEKFDFEMVRERMKPGVISKKKSEEYRTFYLGY